LVKKLLDIIKENSKPMDPVATGLNASSIAVKNIKSVIFDIYGTLLQSATGDIGSNKKQSKSGYFLDALKQSGIIILNSKAGQTGLDYFYEEIDLAHKKSKKMGVTYPEVIITDIWDTVLTKLIKSKLIYSKNPNIGEIAVLFECKVNPVWPMPDLLKAIKYLQSRNVIMGIISNAQFYTPLLFKALLGTTLEEMGFYSELIEYSYVNGEAKPSANMFKTVKDNLLTKFNITPEDTIYIGNDMLNDIYSAKMEGFKTALFAGDLRSLRLRLDIPELLKEKPDIVITNLNQIIELVK